MSLCVFPNEEECLKDLNYRARGLRVGLIPCTSSFHPGYHQMFRKAREDNDWVVVVDLAGEELGQEGFGPRGNDLSERDREDLLEYGVDAYLRLDPLKDLSFEIRDQKMSTSLNLNPELTARMCTRFMGLFSLYHPARVYFYDLYLREILILKELIKQFFPWIEPVSLPLIRSEDGLAFSSVNYHLTASETQQCYQLNRTLRENFRDCVGLSIHRISQKVVDALEDKDFEGVKVFFLNQGGRHTETIGRETRLFASVKIREFTLVDFHSLQFRGDLD